MQHRRQHYGRLQLNKHHPEKNTLAPSYICCFGRLKNCQIDAIRRACKFRSLLPKSTPKSDDIRWKQGEHVNGNGMVMAYRSDMIDCFKGHIRSGILAADWFALAACTVHGHNGDDGSAHVDGADDESGSQGPLLRVAEGSKELGGVEHDRVDTCSRERPGVS